MYRFQTLVTSYTYRSESSLRYCTVLRAYRVRMYAQRLSLSGDSTALGVTLGATARLTGRTGHSGLEPMQKFSLVHMARGRWTGGGRGRDIYLAYLVV